MMRTKQEGLVVGDDDDVATADVKDDANGHYSDHGHDNASEHDHYRRHSYHVERDNVGDISKAKSSRSTHAYCATWYNCAVWIRLGLLSKVV